LLTTSEATVVAAVAGSGGLSTWIDMRTRRVPNRLTFSIAIAGLVIALAQLGAVTAPQALGGLAVGLALMLPGHVIGATGAGDVKLFAALGTFLGPSGILAGFAYTAIAGGVLALAVAARRRVLRETVERTAVFIQTGGVNAATIEHATTNNRFAYAPAIACGTLLAALGL
jgi:prepilin peptidase CpaA